MLTLAEILNASQENKVENKRELPYPPELVYKAWADPEVMKKWWGPTGFTNTFHKFELKPGGRWIITMHGPDGKDYPNESAFLDIQPNKRLIIHHISQHEFYVIATFEPSGSTKTTFTFRQIFESAEDLQKIKLFLLEKNEENIDRLEAQLAILAT
jgi:uncharacterized protein YndB with AHSA1/START domain